MFKIISITIKQLRLLGLSSNSTVVTNILSGLIFLIITGLFS